MQDCKVNILGIEYQIHFASTDEDKYLEDVDGYCDYTDCRIVLRSNNKNELGDFERNQKKQLRHELIHAFMAESGLASNWQHVDQFGHDETTVDWFAIQSPKIFKLFTELDLL